MSRIDEIRARQSEGLQTVYVMGNPRSEDIDADADIDWLLSEHDRLSAELSAVDMVLARRSALDDIPNRVDKIIKAIETAKTADRLSARCKELEEGVRKLAYVRDDAGDRCLICGYYGDRKIDDHSNDCWLAKLIEGGNAPDAQ